MPDRHCHYASRADTAITNENFLISRFLKSLNCNCLYGSFSEVFCLYWSCLVRPVKFCSIFAISICELLALCAYADEHEVESSILEVSLNKILPEEETKLSLGVDGNIVVKRIEGPRKTAIPVSSTRPRPSIASIKMRSPICTRWHTNSSWSTSSPSPEIRNSKFAAKHPQRVRSKSKTRIAEFFAGKPRFLQRKKKYLKLPSKLPIPVTGIFSPNCNRVLTSPSSVCSSTTSGTP